MFPVKQVTVYADVQDEELLKHITTAALDLCEDAVIHRVSDKDVADPLAFINMWEKERDDVWPFVKNNVPFMHRFECFATDSKDKKSGAVAYALYFRKMPVLSLVVLEVNQPSTIVNVANNNEDNEEDWITRELYFTPNKLRCVSLSDAVNLFFAFPATGGNVVAIEGEDAAVVMSQCRLLRDSMQSESNLPVHIVDASGCDITDMNTETSNYGEEYSLYATLIDCFLNNSNNSELCQIREVHPQLHGALCALNRYHNLPILRFRLQSGARIIFYRPFSIVFEELVLGCRKKEMNVSQTQALLSTVIPLLLHFETHWLGMPNPEVILIREKANDESSCFTTPSLDHWSTLLLGEGGKSVVKCFSKWQEKVVEKV